MKGIILGAGNGTRLGAITRGIGKGSAVAKPLVPTYDKPTIYYPLSDLITAGIKDILVIAAPDNVDQFQATLGTGAELGIKISYDVQPVPRGIAEAFIIGEDFIGNDNVALVFGDNIFSGHSFTRALREQASFDGARVFAYHVPNPEAFGVVEFDARMRAVSIEEKPKVPKSNYAVVGIYFYTPDVVGIAKSIKPSDRGELEISDVNQAFLDQGRISVIKLDSDTHWFDTGTPDSLRDASEYIRAEQAQWSRLIGSPEASAYLAGFIDQSQLLELAEPLRKSTYGQLLLKLAKEGWQ